MYLTAGNEEGVDALRVDALERHGRVAKPMSAVREFLALRSDAARPSLFARLTGRNPIPVEHREAFRRASGDVAVSDTLAQLGAGWMVFRSVPVGREMNALEYVAIGPAGVYSIAIRHQPGRAIWIDGRVLLVEGERMPCIREAEFEAVSASQLLSDVIGSRVEVTPCLVIVDPRSLTVSKPPRRVAVLTPRDLRPWLKDMPRVLSPERLDEFRAAASGQESWQDIRNPSATIADQVDEFRKIQSEVNQARHVRLTWVTGALVMIWLIAMVGIGGFTTSLLVP